MTIFGMGEGQATAGAGPPPSAKDDNFGEGWGGLKEDVGRSC
jgi:hypothetical protein